jgi:hypothetical protein
MDVFTFKIRLPYEDAIQMKRKLLSSIAMIYDPQGFVALVTLEAKKLLQSVTRMKARWDDPLPASVLQEWERWCAKLPAVESYTIPRVSGGPLGISQARQRELHIFCDASETGYGACAYLRLDAGEMVTTSLVLGKSRLAPIKPSTIRC